MFFSRLKYSVIDVIGYCKEKERKMHISSGKVKGHNYKNYPKIQASLYEDRTRDLYTGLDGSIRRGEVHNILAFHTWEILAPRSKPAELTDLGFKDRILNYINKILRNALAHNLDSHFIYNSLLYDTLSHCRTVGEPEMPLRANQSDQSTGNLDHRTFKHFRDCLFATRCDDQGFKIQKTQRYLRATVYY